MAIPTKTDDDLGRPKIDKPRPFPAKPDLRWDIPAAEWERIKDRIIESATALANGGVANAVVALDFLVSQYHIVHVLGTAGSGVDLLVEEAPATDADIMSGEALYLALEEGTGGQTIAVALRGVVANLTVAGSPAYDDAVYVTDAATLSVVPGTNTRRIGKVLHTSGGLTTVAFDGAYGAGGSAVGTLGLSLLGTGSGSAFGVPKTKTTVSSASSYAVAETDRLVILTGAGACACTLDGTAPPSGYAKVVRIVVDGPSSVLIKDPASSPLCTIPGFVGAYVDVVTEDGSSYQVLGPSLANAGWFGSDVRGDLAVRGASLWARLALGAAGSVLTSDGTDPGWKTLAVITDPPAASTGNVSCDATATPRSDYYMAPSANRTFDPTTATVSQRITITKTTTSTNKITLPAVVGWKYYPAGATNTALDLAGSGVNSDTAYHQWTLTIDAPNKIVYVSPAA